jgi:hypothetical protein
MQKLKRSEVSLEGSGKLTSSCLDYPIFLLNPQLLNLIPFYRPKVFQNKKPQAINLRFN